MDDARAARLGAGRSSSATSRGCCVRPLPGTGRADDGRMDGFSPADRLGTAARMALLAHGSPRPAGLAVAAPPRCDAARRLHALTLLTLFLTFDLVLFGSFTRLTDSGLGCPDWPGCYGSASPLGARDEIHAAQTALPSGPVTHGKAWIEMIHRYLATAVGVLITVIAMVSWVAATHRAAAAPIRRGGPR